MTSSWAARASVAWVTLAIVSAASRLAHAEEPQQGARAHFDRGLRLVDTNRFEEAAAEFQTAHSLQPHPSVLYNLGMAQAAARRPALAMATLNEYLTSNDAERNQARTLEVQKRIAELETKIGYLDLKLDPPDATVRIDGRLQRDSARITLDPGQHSLVVAASGHAPQEQEVFVSEGERKVLSVQLTVARDEMLANDSSLQLQQPKVASIPPLQVAPTPDVANPRSTRPPTVSSANDRATKTPPWLLATMAGTGVLLAATTAGLVVDSNARYSEWRREEDAITAGRRAMMLAADLPERQRSNNRLANRIKLEDELAVGAGVASGLVLVATAVWWLLDPKLAPRSVAFYAAARQGLIVGTY